MSKYNAIQHYNNLINEYKRGNKSWFIESSQDRNVSVEDLYNQVVEELQITRDLIHSMDLREFRFVLLLRNLPLGVQRNFRDCLERCFELMLELDDLPASILELKQEIDKKL